MIFTFDGSADELIEKIYSKAEENNKDIIVYQPETDVLEIGFQRLAYTGGRFFVADITESDGKVTLSGEFKNIYDNQSDNGIISWLLVYGFIEAIPLIIWLLVFRLRLIIVPLILPIPIMLFLYFRRKHTDENKEIDNNFISFLSSFGKVNQDL